jgi:hypothetical protein
VIFHDTKFHATEIFASRDIALGIKIFPSEPIKKKNQWNPMASA